MDDTVLKDLDFSEKNKAIVRKSFVNNTYSNKTVRIPRMGFVLSLCFCTLFIGSIGYFILNQEGSLKQENQATKQKADEEKETVNLPVPKENYEEMSKEEIVTRLLNSVDYFATAAGTYETFDSFYDGSTSKTKVEYKYSNKKVIGGYQKVINYPDDKNPHSELREEEYYYNQEHMWNIDLNTKQYVLQDYFGFGGKKDKVLADDVFHIDLYKLYDSEKQFRERPPVSGNLFSYEFVAGYLRYKDQWEIEKQNVEVIGHNTMVIYGHIDESIREINIVQPDEESFRIWVDKDTGIMLKKETYNQNEEIISSLTTTSLVINKEFKEKEFIPVVDQYNRYIPTSYVNDEREYDIEVTEHADVIPTAVQKVMNIQRETIPYYYEFNDTKVSPFSASIEKYQNQLQAYVVYSFDKPETEKGSGSKLLYTRMYPKDTVVRTTGDFNAELGEELENVMINDIQWKVYEIVGIPNFHLKGQKNEYVYEIVTQDVPLDEVKRLLETFK